MSMASDMNHFAYEAVTSYDSALNNFFIAANRLHLCAERLFEGTPYKPDKWPEIWMHEVALLQPFISEEQYANLVVDEVDTLKGHGLPERFEERLHAFDLAFEAECSRMLQAVEDLRAYMPINRRAQVYRPRDVSKYFEKKIICRPRKPPFPEYDYGVGLLKVTDDPRKANKNGRDTNRVQFMTTELVLMICLLMNLPRVQVFLALFPYKWKNNLTNEWENLWSLGISYYYTLYRYTTIEAIFDDLLVLLGCYELYITLGLIKPDSEKLIILLFSMSRIALSHRRFWEHVKAYTCDEREEVMVRFVLNHMLTPRLKSGSRLLNIFLRDLQAVDTAKFAEVAKLNPIQFSGPCGYPKAC